MKEILIKKYDNRRLYCVEEARYVSLSEIRDFLQRGDKVKVVEKSTGKDITKYILMQVLLEERYDLLPTYFYQMILQSPPEAIDSFFKKFFPWMMDVYKGFQEGNFSMPTMPGMPQMPQMPFQNPWMQTPFNPFMQQQPQPAKAEKPEFAEEGSDETMAAILKRLRELEAKVKSGK
ncbi:MAG: polyhydroxyalkanoate synthesis repressor PhaR [uncultured bacterium]|nr:MAG: polyhydroxyalkanoate synthesis repressor PhaR [uncultured bacterium]